MINNQWASESKVATMDTNIEAALLPCVTNEYLLVSNPNHAAVERTRLTVIHASSLFVYFI
jgi:hypothetical protein